jgi:hypothetical protein
MRRTNAGSSSFCLAAYRWFAAPGPAPGRPFAQRLLRPASDARARPPGVSAKGLCVSQVVQRFLEDLLVECDLRQRVLESAVFKFEFFETRGRVGLYAAVLLTLAVEGGLADRELLADLADGRTRR